MLCPGSLELQLLHRPPPAFQPDTAFMSSPLSAEDDVEVMTSGFAGGHDFTPRVMGDVALPGALPSNWFQSTPLREGRRGGG